MFLDDWTGLVRVLIVGPLAYFALVVMLRLSGPRTLAKMSAYDFVVTIAIGSMLASIIVTETVSLVEGLLAMLVLILLQIVITWLSVRSDTVSRAVTGEPILVFHDGRFLRGQMRKARVTDSEMLSAMRLHGYVSQAEVGSMILETDGTFSVTGQTGPEPGESTLRDID